MKKILLLLAVSAFLLSCSSNSPRSVAESFIKASLNMDVDKMMSYMDKQTASEAKAELKEMTKEEKKQMEEFRKEALKEIKGTKFEFVKEEIDGDEATVTFLIKDPEGKEKEKNIYLIKEDSKWVIENGSGIFF